MMKKIKKQLSKKEKEVVRGEEERKRKQDQGCYFNTNDQPMPSMEKYLCRDKNER
jgi:hypothetical protein